MKKLLYIIPCMMLMLTSCDWFVLDNLDGHDATIAGSIIDAQTGALVPNELPGNRSYITVYELGWDGEVAQNWYSKPNGTYKNDLVFSGNYRFNSVSSNYYPNPKEFTIVPGDNTVDFTVTPYARIINPEFSYDATTHKLIATFSAEFGDPSKTSTASAVFCCYTDRFVGNQLNSCKNVPGATAASITADGTTRITLEIDTKSSLAENSQFTYSRTHYVRVAVLAKGPGVNLENRYNFSPTYAISSDFSKVSEVTNW